MEHRTSTLELRQKLREELLATYEKDGSKFISPEILNSEAFIHLHDYIKTKQFLPADNPLWREMEETVRRVSPEFISNLKILTLGKLTLLDIQTCLLIKFGVKPSEMTFLLRRAKGTIVSRRENLGKKIFDRKTGSKTTDGIISLI